MVGEWQHVQATAVGNYDRIGAAGCNSLYQACAVPIGAQGSPIVAFSGPGLEEYQTDVWWSGEDGVAKCKLVRSNQHPRPGQSTYKPLLFVTRVLFNTYCTRALLCCCAALALMASNGEIM